MWICIKMGGWSEETEYCHRNWGPYWPWNCFFMFFPEKKTWHSSRDTGSIRFRKPLNLGGPLFSDKPVWVSTQSPSSKGQLWHVNEWNPQSCWRTKKNVIAELEVPLSVGFKWKVNMLKHMFDKVSMLVKWTASPFSQNPYKVSPQVIFVALSNPHEDEKVGYPGCHKPTMTGSLSHPSMVIFGFCCWV